MAKDVISGAEGENSVLQGTEDDYREPTGTEVTDGEPNDTPESTQTEGEPNGKEPTEPKADDLAQLRKDFKNLQSAFNKRDSEVSDLRDLQARVERMGGLDSLEQAYNFISTDQDMLKLIQQKQMKQQGAVIDYSQYDDDTQKALKLVEDIIDKKTGYTLNQVEQLLAKRLDESVNPIVEKERIREATSHMAKLEQNYPDWREMKDTMDELIETLPETIQDNPSYEDIEYLYHKALKQEGKFDDYAANVYKSKLEKLKKESSDTAPSSQVQRTKPKAKTMREAFNLAKKEHKV